MPKVNILQGEFETFSNSPKVMWNAAIDLFTLLGVESEGTRYNFLVVCGPTFWMDRGGTHEGYGSEWKG